MNQEPSKIVKIRRTCDTSACCGCGRGEGCSPIHREDSSPSGSRAAGLAHHDSWLAQRPWIWFWVAFAVLLTLWTAFMIIAVKYQPASVPLQLHR